MVQHDYKALSDEELEAKYKALLKSKDKFLDTSDIIDIDTE